MATVAEIEAVLSTLSEQAGRADKIKAEIAALDDQRARLVADLDQLSPAVDSAQAELKRLVGELDLVAVKK